MPIYCQYIVYCDNILNIATIFSITLNIVVGSCSDATQTVRDDYLWLRLSQSMKMDGFEKLEIDPNQKNFIKLKKKMLATNSREFHIAIYCSLGIKNMTMSQYSPQTHRIYCNIRFREQYAIYIAYIAIYCNILVDAIYGSLPLMCIETCYLVNHITGHHWSIWLDRVSVLNHGAWNIYGRNKPGSLSFISSVNDAYTNISTIFWSVILHWCFPW